MVVHGDGGRSASSLMTTMVELARRVGERSTREALVVDDGHRGTGVREPVANSSPVHHALSGTTTAPMTTAPQKVMTHSGRLRAAIATRSPVTHAKFDETPGEGGRVAR